MKIPRKINLQAWSTIDINPFELDTSFTKTWHYAHDNRVFAEIAGHVFNKYLEIQEREDKLLLSTEWRLSFGSKNPHKARLHIAGYISDLEKMQVKSTNEIKERVYENAVEEILHKSMDNNDKIHKLRSSFWARLKFLFNKK
jgi:hypothetical protein